MNFGCSHFQCTKNVWKGTKEMWYEYMSPPASIDYSDVSTLSDREQALVNGMMGIDTELTKLERFMSNADRTPTRSWAEQFFVAVPWVDGFAGVRADGSLLGNIPAPGKTAVTVDWVPLLYEPEKQSSRALRADVQPGPDGPQVLVAAAMYDGVDFLGVVSSYFKMSSLIDKVKNPDDVVILTPYALLWSKFDYGSTPMAGIDWAEAVTKSASGTVSNENGKFAYQVRWLANLPVIFCVAEEGSFARTSGSLAGTEKYFPKREKKPVPPLKERSKNLLNSGNEEFMAPKPGQEAQGGQAGPASGSSEIEAGSSRSVLLNQGGVQKKGRVRERDLGGEGTYQPRQKPRPQQRRRMPIVIPDMTPEEPTPRPRIEAPSPFGPKKQQAQPAQTEEAKPDASQQQAPAASQAPAAQPAAPAAGEQKPAESKPAADQAKPLDMKVAPVAPKLSGGRLSPFGPRAAQPEASEQKAPEKAAEPADKKDEKPAEAKSE